MPLSDQEQRILEEIERNLYAEDPGLARQIRSSSPRAVQRRRVRVGAGLFALGLIALLAFFLSGQIVIGVVAFACMVGGIVLGAGSLVALVAGGAGQAQSRIQAARVRFEERLRARHKRD